MLGTVPTSAVSFLAVAVVALGALAVGHWVHLDAGARGSDSPLEWAVACALMAPLLLAYLPYRRRIGRHPGPGPRQRAAGTLAFGFVTALLLTPTVTPPDPLAQVRLLPALFVVGIALGYLLVWLRGVETVRRAVRGGDSRRSGRGE